jgi:mono/diheme cytochrome c family protein
MNEGPERIDYRETSDVTEVHAAIKREHGDPRAESTPIPLWLSAVCGVAICWAGAYLGVFHGGFSSSIYNEYESSPLALFGAPSKKGNKETAPAAVLSLADQGKAVYAQCVTCHQPTGLGVPGQYPHLAKSEYVVGSEKRLVAILLKGLQGPITLDGKPFVSAAIMPAWEGSLNDKKIAAVASFVRREWGNAAPEISEAKVAAARKEFAGKTGALTEADLLQIPADATLPDAAGAAPAAPATAPAAPATSPAAPAAPVAPAAATKPPGTEAAPAAADPAVLAQGKAGYMTVCFACHQATGLGLPMVFPPLVKTEYVLGDAKRLAAMILKGVMGPITVEGKQYANVMPGQELMLNDEKIAAILTYVRASFGNNASPISPEIVAAARKEFAEKKTSWTEAELKAFGTTAAPAAETPAAPAPAPATPAAPVPAPVPTTPAPAAPAPAPSAPAPAPTAPEPTAPTAPAAPEPTTPAPSAPAAPAPVAPPTASPATEPEPVPAPAAPEPPAAPNPAQ